MSLKVIELNDAALKVGDESGVLIQSPGFALAQEKNLIIGEAAEQKARLHPTQSYNKYWHELSLDPLSHGNGIRHHADIAYAQLQHLAEEGGVDDEVLFAVPGNFTRQQVAILLGLAKQCPFTTIGVVDSALAAAFAAAGKQSLIYAELQLHQVLLTKLQLDGEQLKVQSVTQVPGVGSQNIVNQMMQMATNAFIQQSRFNPQHNAETEQQLYNALPHWWRQPDRTDGSLVLELRVGESVYTAKMPRDSLVSGLGPHYQKINQQLVALAAETESKLLLNSSLSALPGLQQLLAGERDTEVVDSGAISATSLELHEHLRSGEQGIRLVTALKIGSTSTRTKRTTATSAADTKLQPTHVLYNNQAFAIDQVQITNNKALNGHAPANTIALSLAGLPEHLGQIQLRDREIFLDSGKLEYLLNAERVSGRKKLALGDRIQFTADSAALVLIRVN